jgi:hypothetical protein
MKTQKNTITLSTVELIEVLRNLEVKGGTLTNIVMETTPRMKKTGNPWFNKLVKRSSCNYLMGNDYEDRVHTNEIKEGMEPNFVVEKPKGKTKVEGSQILYTDDKTRSKFYVMVERFDEIKPNITFSNVETNEVVDKGLFDEFLYKSYPSQKQTQERKVMVITPLVSNIKEMSVNGVKYIVENE